MQYAQITNGEIVRIDTFAAELPAHKLRPDLLPVVDVVPDFDPATQMLGAETLTIERNRVARTWEVVAQPPAPRDIQAELEAKVASLETFIAGNGDATAPDARTRLRAIEDALAANSILTKEAIDAHLKSTYRDNGDGTISRLDRLGIAVATFDPKGSGTEETLYATWLSMGGKPLPPDATALSLELARA
jgi:hypothetical protein